MNWGVKQNIYKVKILFEKQFILTSEVFLFLI